MKAIIRRIRTPRARSYAACRELVDGAIGIEFGGPTPLFARGGLLPVYPLVARVDNCNCAQQTVWEGAITEGYSFAFDPRKPRGRQFVAEGADLGMIQDEAYSFVLSSHTLEHAANPLRALTEWSRLLRPGGALLLVVPHRDGMFDHRRPVTTLQHLIDDFNNSTREDDLTHLQVVLDLHDLSRDPGARAVDFRERAKRNVELRTLYHHVFDTSPAVAAVTQAGFDVVSVEPLEPYHVIVVARKPRAGGAPPRFGSPALPSALRNSPFRIDRQVE